MRKIIIPFVVTLAVLTTFIDLGYSQNFVYKDTCFYSNILDETKCIRAYLPPGYEADTATYPVIYYLHGAGGTYEDVIDFMPWLEEMIEDSVIDTVLYIGLDGHSPPYSGTMFANSILNGLYEDYLIQEAIPFAESVFRTKNSFHYRCISGGSMGGYGSMMLQLKHPDIFTGVASFAGPLQLDTLTTLWIPGLIAENSGPPYNFTYPAGTFTNLSFMVAGAFSPNLNILPNQVEFLYDENCDIVDSVFMKWKEFDCSRLVKNLDIVTYDNPGLFFACGTNDNLHFYPSNTCFEDTLMDLGINYTFYTNDVGHIVSQDMFQAGMLFLDSIMHDSIYVGIDPISRNELIDLSVFPNPVQDKLSVVIRRPARSGLVLSIFNIQGQQLFTQPITKHKTEIDLSHLPKGIYIVKVWNDKDVMVRKVIKQ